MISDDPFATADAAGLPRRSVIPWGPGVAKVALDAIAPPRAKHVVVTAITPTKHGEGKTVTAIGLVDALRALGRNAIGTLRQPSLGPVFGLKGGATGGGRALLVPAERIDLHLTGDEHAVSAAHNLLSAFSENHVFHGNPLGIEEMTWPRASSISDRSLRSIELELREGARRSSSFVITAASEVMAILALARDAADLRSRLGRIVVGASASGQPSTAEDIHAAGAMATLLMEAVLPNLVRTSEGSPILLHAGPFANVAHGNSSVIADRVAAGIADLVVTEAGFGADLGFEKLVDLKVAAGGFAPDAAVIVATLRALGSHGDPDAGRANLRAAVDIVRSSGVPAVVAFNAFPTDDLHALGEACAWVQSELGIEAVVSDAFGRGGEGTVDLAHALGRVLDRERSVLEPFQRSDATTTEKLTAVATRVYGASGVELGPEAMLELDRLVQWGADRLPVCVAKTPLSLSHDPSRKGVPRGFALPVRLLELCAGAGFVVAWCGDVQRMPGLPKHPRGETMELPS